MVIVLNVLGALTVLAGVVVGVDVSRTAPDGSVVALYSLGGALSSMLWFALAAILNRQNEIYNVLKLSGEAVGGRGDVAGRVVILSREKHGSTPAFIRARLGRRSEVLAAYGSLQEAVEPEWEHLSTVVGEGESLHATPEAAQVQAKAPGVRGNVYEVTRAQFRRELEWVLPRVRG